VKYFFVQNINALLHIGYFLPLDTSLYPLSWENVWGHSEANDEAADDPSLDVCIQPERKEWKEIVS